MRILLITDGIMPFVTGGMQRHSFFLFKYLIKSGQNVHLVHCGPMESEERIGEKEVYEECGFGEKELGYASVTFVPFPKSDGFPGHYLRASVKYSKLAFKAVKSGISTFDFIYAKGFCGFEFIKRRNLGELSCPIGVKLHGLNMYQPQPNLTEKLKARWLRTLSDYLIKHADYNFSYGGKITDKLLQLGVPASQIIEVPTGIEEEWLQPKAVGPIVKRFIFIGRFDRVKGLPELLAAVLGLGKKLQWELIIVGPVPRHEKIVHSNVTFKGKLNLDEIKEELKNSDVLICPSWSEGMPNVILEAMSCGCAILSTNTGAVSVMVNHHNGILIEFPDKKIIAEKILEIQDFEEPQILKLKSSSIERIENEFLWSKIIARQVESLKNVI